MPLHLHHTILNQKQMLRCTNLLETKIQKVKKIKIRWWPVVVVVVVDDGDGVMRFDEDSISKRQLAVDQKTSTTSLGSSDMKVGPSFPWPHNTLRPRPWQAQRQRP